MKIFLIRRFLLLAIAVLVITVGDASGKIAEQCCCEISDLDCADKASWACCHLNSGTTGDCITIRHDGYCFDQDICWAVIVICCEEVSGNYSRPINILCECQSAICYHPH